MLTKKKAGKILGASLVASSIFSTAVIPTFAQEITPEEATQTTINHQASLLLDEIHQKAFEGKFPGKAEKLQIGTSTKEDVFHVFGKPEHADRFDVYPANMGHAGYAFAYDKEDKVKEIRYFGTNVERQTNLGEITKDVLQQRFGQPKETLQVPGTNEVDYVYTTGKYALHFVMKSETSAVDHINLKATK